jgi:hypothetical protein
VVRKEPVVVVVGGAPGDALRDPYTRQEVAETAFGAPEGEKCPCRVAPLSWGGQCWLFGGVA